MKIIKKIILKIIGVKNLTELIDVNILSSKLIEHKINNCNNQVTKSVDSRFYEEALVYNFQNNKSRIVIGSNSHIRGELLVFKYGGNIKIGNNSFVGKGSRLWSGDSLIIGDNVLISHNVNIIDTNSHEIKSSERAERFIELLQNGHWNEKGSIVTKEIVIKSNVWISFNVIILKGVTIGHGAIVAAGAVVTKNVPDWTIVAGNPAKIVRVIPENER